MRDNNKLILNESTLIEALQEYLDRRARNGRAEFTIISISVQLPINEVILYLSDRPVPEVDTKVKGAVVSGSYKSLYIEGDGEVSGSYKPIRGDVP